MPDFGRNGPPPAVIADYMRQMAAQAEARRNAGPLLYRMYGGQQPQGAPGAPPGPPGMMPPPPPGTPQGGPQAPPPGQNFAPPPNQGGMPPPPMAGGPQGAPPPAAAGPAAPMAPKPQIQPFRPLPTAMPGAPGQGGVPPPPAAAAPQQQPAPEAMTPPGKQFDMPTLIRGLQSSGVPQEKVMDMLDQLMPVMNAQNKSELESFKAISRAQSAAMQAFSAEIRAVETQRQNDIRETAEQRRKDQGQQKLDIMRARAAGAAGGSGNLKTTEVVYPKGPDGRADETKDPVGVRAVTKSGKILYLDENGVPTTAAALQGGTAKEAKDTKTGASSAVRQNIVKAGVKNSLDRLNEIEKKFPNMNTSAFFGQHGEGPITRGLYGAGRGQMSSGQKQADAMWASMIDEAIPVFTGGLRGSDAFRKFLIEQAPGPGDDAASRKEKVRLLRANIEGTSKAFFNKFSSDPSMWASGITQDQVEEAKGAAPAASGPASPAAPAVGTVKKGFRFKGGDPSKRESWEKVNDSAPPRGGMIGARS